MLRLFNTLSKSIETFRPAKDQTVTIFTCGPSVYGRAHIGNFRTFLFEDILVRYLEYLGYKVKRGMNFTDIEDKAAQEAKKRGISVWELTGKNMRNFTKQMKLLRMKTPHYLPKASESIEEAVAIIDRLLDGGIAYRYRGNIYFDPLKFPDFGRLYGLDMTKWPTKRRRFHQDTYPGMRWNRGDFILWHRCGPGDTVCWDSRIGKGRPSWNSQDASMVSMHFHGTLSIYCGGIDNLFRHHDYTRAILESVRSYPMAKYWLHCHQLVVNGKKMSKGRGNICYTDNLIEDGYTPGEIRFFLIYGHYRKKLNYSRRSMAAAVQRLRNLRIIVGLIRERAMEATEYKGLISKRIDATFTQKMDNDLDVKRAFDAVSELLSGLQIRDLRPGVAVGIMGALRKIDQVLKVIF
ncbi:MAG: class I tRNA ligase family protein [Proteobacteria bacterium]|nr:class I tRNA ligase family protein [Pseudomonadota bacterium]